jgi:nucleotide-binding universal stress UspA family protein
MVNDNFEPICVERILISLDSSSHSFAALHAAVDLALHYDATLRGVFIEDITLLSLTEMPFRQEVGQYSAIVREISTDGITQGIFVQSQWVIHTFHKLINQTNLKSDFSILRGKVSEVIKKEAEDCDLLIIGKAGTNTMKKQKLGSTARALIQKGQKTLLLVEENNRLGYPLIVFFDNSPVGQIGLETARDLLDGGETLIILIHDDDSSHYQNNKKNIIKWASKNEINISIQNYNARNFDRFIQRIDGLKEGLCILPNIRDDEKRALVEYCLERVTLPILLIQPSQSDEKIS